MFTNEPTTTTTKTLNWAVLFPVLEVFKYNMQVQHIELLRKARIIHVTRH